MKHSEHIALGASLGRSSQMMQTPRTARLRNTLARIAKKDRGVGEAESAMRMPRRLSRIHLQSKRHDLVNLIVGQDN